MTDPKLHFGPQFFNSVLWNDSLKVSQNFVHNHYPWNSPKRFVNGFEKEGLFGGLKLIGLCVGLGLNATGLEGPEGLNTNTVLVGLVLSIGPMGWNWGPMGCIWGPMGCNWDWVLEMIALSFFTTSTNIGVKAPSVPKKYLFYLVYCKLEAFIKVVMLNKLCK